MPSHLRIDTNNFQNLLISPSLSHTHTNKENIKFTTPIQQSFTWGWVPHTGAHPHVRGCCTVVVLVLYKNQIPTNNDSKLTAMHVKEIREKYI
jgi:hypothetical protein